MKFSRLATWLLYLGTDAFGRFVLQIGSTVIFARLLTEIDFGRAALTISLVQVLAILVSAPAEECLVQRRVVRKAHFNAFLAAAMMLSVVLIVLTASVALWPWASTGSADLHLLVAVFSLILLAEGPVAILNAAARRSRRFKVIAKANFAGLAAGTVVGLLLAVAGGGVWSLLAVRIVARFVLAGWLAIGVGIRFTPRWSSQHLRQLIGFAGWHTVDRLVTVLCEAVFQSLVSLLLGLGANGYLNMAMRIIEPVRGISGAASHNIAMSLFTRMQTSREQLASSMARATRQTSLILVPVFLGLAGISNTLILLLAGPDWAPAVQIAILLAIAAAIQSPFEFVHTATTSLGRADLGFYTSLCNLAGLSLAIWLLSPLGLIAIGLSRLVYYLIDAGWALALVPVLFDGSPVRFLRGLVPVLFAGSVMGILVAVLPGILPAGTTLPGVLLFQISLGVVIFALLILLLAKENVLAAGRQLIQGEN